MNAHYTCPVCGYPGLKEEPRRPGGGGSYEICWSCGFEFGFTDEALDYTDEAWRQRWIDRGMLWDGEAFLPAPPGWDPAAQLAALLSENNE